MYLNRKHLLGFTLIELLVVTAIISVMIGLILSAVQTVRSAAAKAKCQNNLKQIVLGLHQLHDASLSFPSGHRSSTNKDRMPFSGWTLSVLPYLEESAIFHATRDAYQKSLSPFINPPHVHISQVIRGFTCPSDYRVSGAQIAEEEKILVAFTSYLGISGQNYSTKDGVLFQDSRVQMIDVVDGASNTLLLGERPPSYNYQYGWWYAGIGQLRTGSAEMILGVKEINLLPVFSGSPCGPGSYFYTPGNGFDDPCGMFHYWSPHSGGANFGFVDGSIRFLRYEASAIMPALATRSGGEVTPFLD